MAFKFSQSDLNAINAAKAIRDYNDAEASLAARSLANQQAQSKQKQGGLLGVLQGIGESIGNVGSSLYNIAGTGAASIGDLFASIGSGKVTTKNQDDWKQHMKRLNGDENMSDKDYYLKTAGKSLDAAATVSDFIPGLGKAGKVALNVGQGVASGVGNQFATNGENTTLEQALQGGLIGGVSAGAGQAVGSGLAAKGIPGNGRIAKALNSNVARGAMTGAASGAVGGGLATALQGGDFGQTLQGALEGAGTGALSGGTTAGIYDLVGAGVNKVNDRILNGKKSTTQTPTNVMADTEETIPEGTRRRQTPMDWAENDISGQAKKQNYLQKLGGDLQDVSQATRDSAVYGRLEGNTAKEMIKKDAINNLRKNYGYTPDDYEQASNLSTAINKWYDNEIQSSGAEKVNTKLSSNLTLPDNNTLPEKYEKAYKATIQNAMNMANAGDSNVVDKYTAGGLERAAKYLGEQEQKLRRTNMNGVDGRPDGDRAELANYYKEARQMLRNEVDSMIELDDITRNNLSKLLDNAGATEQAKKAILSAKNFSEVKSSTAPLEDARTMVRQMKSSGLKRSAAGDNSASFVTQAANAAGVNDLMKVGLKPVRSAVAGAEKAVGKAVSAVGDATAGSANGPIGKTVGATAKLAKTAATAPNLNVGPIDMDSVITGQIARKAGQNVANDVALTREQTDAQNALKEAQKGYNTALANYQNTMAQAQAAQAQNSEGAQKLQQISDAMEAALAAGDITAYNKLADLYSTAYKIYGKELEAAQAAANPLSNLSSTQLENVNKLDVASNAIDELEALFNKAGGGQGLIGGNAANFMASLGLNSDVSTYNSLSRGLINQIGAAIGKTDSLNTEGEVNRALELIPKFTDDAQTAANKLEQLRQMLATNKQSVYKNYGLTS